MMTKKKLTRGISKEFADAFRNCELYQLYHSHKDELFIGIRNNYLNLYYNCDSIAKVTYKAGILTCEIASYYLYDTIEKSGNLKCKTNCLEISKNYEKIKAKSSQKSTYEKKAQSKLILLNNSNVSSNWFCFDVEWVKAFENINQKAAAEFNGRFDIVAISKKKPHNVALIELKYGSDAIGGASGIYKHIKDFKKYKDNNYFDKQEIVGIIESYKMLGICVPSELQNISTLEINSFEFFVITINNNAAKQDVSTPKQTMSGYLFNDGRWNCKKISKKTVQADFGDVTDKTNSIHVNFLFSKQTLDNLTINDIIEHIDYERK